MPASQVRPGDRIGERDGALREVIGVEPCSSSRTALHFHRRDGVPLCVDPVARFVVVRGER